MEKPPLRWKFRPRNDIRLQKIMFRTARLLSKFRPDLKERIELYMIDLGTEFGFTKKHMAKLFQNRMKYRVETEES